MLKLKKNQSLLVVISLSCAFTIAAVILIFFRFLPEKLPLFYSLPWGEAQLAHHRQFLILPVSIILICTFNFILSQQLHHSQSFFKKVLILSSLISTLILSVTFIKIILIFI
ncbi:hypothetical protein HYZ05_01560 [Candidatus Daviesbacteria bacterium]|nr:hypothetical protein [Candidatus Daviesbacteria bacterium]